MSQKLLTANIYEDRKYLQQISMRTETTYTTANIYKDRNYLQQISIRTETTDSKYLYMNLV